MSKEYYNRILANKYTNYSVRKDMPLLEFLMNCVPGTTRTKAKQLLHQRMVYVDNAITTQFDCPLKEGQLVQIASRGNLHQLNNKFVKIVYEDAFLIVVEKSEGIITNTIPGGRENSVKRILDEYVKRRNRAISVHTVHRLDRVTSGLMLFAKQRDVQQMFTEHWHEIVTDRRYIAVTEGKLEQSTGTISSWLTDNKMYVTYSTPYDNGGKYAVTHYRQLKSNDEFSLVELKLETGRKNQIRVHMQELKHPVVGDLKYGSSLDPVSRVCLHAYKLEFYHPVTRELLRFSTPIPSRFEALVKKKG